MMTARRIRRARRWRQRNPIWAYVNSVTNDGRGWGSGERGRAILDAIVSDVAAVEVGGGPWDENWEGTAEMREPLNTLAGAEVDVHAVAEFFAPLGDVAPGL